MATRPQKNIVITGVSRGLGRALILEFARLGHTVLGCARSQDPLTELRKLLPSPHDLAVVDITDPAMVRTWAERILAAWGPPDLLINNAGTINANAPLWKVPADELSHMVDVNLKGPAYVLRAFIPAMIERGSGIVVNFSSGLGRSTSPELAPYCASKWAIEGLTRALAEELPAGLAAVTLNPGIIDTAMLRSCFGEGAGAYSGPDVWARRVAPFLLTIGVKDNGRPLTAPS
jgi:NAD(P)-dependent dehydrogenase (short-subunit alcohol dehydrogenase family)